MAVKDSMLYDNSFRDSKYKSENKNFDYKKILLEKKKINKDFLNMIKTLTLEELIFLKLDSAAMMLSGKLLNFPILRFVPNICREALVIYALSSTKNKREACAVLGINKYKLNNYIKEYNLKRYLK